MSNKTVTNVDMNRGTGFDDAIYQDEVLNMAGADELVKGTILARDSVSGKLVLFVKGGVTNENGIPKVVLPYDLSIAGAGDTTQRVLVKGQCLLTRLVIDADGDNSNIDTAVKDQLRDYGIIVRDARDLSLNEA